MTDTPDILTRVSNRIALVLRYVAAAGIFLLMALVFLSVFFRYVLNSPILATEDMMAILLGVTIFTAVPNVTMTRSHISVELFVAPFRKFPTLDRARRILIDLGVIGVTFYMAFLMYLQATRQFDRETESFVMEWDLWPVTASFAVLIVIGGSLFALRVIKDRGNGKSEGGLDI